MLMKALILFSNESAYAANVSDSDRKMISDVNKIDATDMQKNRNTSIKNTTGRAHTNAANKTRANFDGCGLSCSCLFDKTLTIRLICLVIV